MRKPAAEDLEKIRDRVSKEMSLRLAIPKIKIIVHTGDSGIAAGARKVMRACDELQYFWLREEREET
ncbi:MAG: hypothetical protein V1714_00930 [Pseudomonadota bacterium]